MPEAYIPQKTLEKIQTPVQKGERHKVAMEIAIPMVGNGVPDNVIFATLRSKFESDVTDRELENVVAWARKQNPTPSVPTHTPAPRFTSTPKPPQQTPLEKATWWTNGTTLTPEAITGLSPIGIPHDRIEYASLVFASLYSETDSINIVCKFIQDGDKARPVGGGRTLTRDRWIEYFQKGVPQSDAGGWIRPNPCGPGTGADGSITDADITSLRFVLVESDCLPLDVQLCLLHRFKLPVAAIILSGGASAHAWVKVQAKDLFEYKELTKRLLETLKPFGFDTANSNASRLSRLPGAVRTIGAIGDGEQRLLYLNPAVNPLTPKTLKAFEDTLAFPFVEDRPLKHLAQQAIERYAAMVDNKGKLGVPTGVQKLDSISGGMKPGHTWVIAGQTGGGKSTFALHVTISALNAGYGVLLFSLEMCKEEIFDLIMSNVCNVNRNAFNNGDFKEDDINRMTARMANVANLPLYIEDSALAGVEQIKSRVMQLKADGKIQLVIVDYIQFVNPGFSKDNREQQVANISHVLRQIARESNLPMVVLSQINDEGKLRESRVIAHNANVVLSVEMVESSVDEKGNKIGTDQFRISVVKGRSIPKDSFLLNFESRYGRLVNPTKIEASDYNDN